MNNWVYALQTHGTNLIAGGAFTLAGGNAANGIASWNGAAWSPLGQSVNHIVESLAVHDGELIAGGRFGSVNATPGVNLTYIAKWTGTTWTPLNAGMNSWVHALSVVNGNLYAGGIFTAAGSRLANRVALAVGEDCPADTNNSGAVDVDDLITVILGWGVCP
jgi:hypothetical protein